MRLTTVIKIFYHTAIFAMVSILHTCVLGVEGFCVERMFNSWKGHTVVQRHNVLPRFVREELLVNKLLV